MRRIAPIVANVGLSVAFCVSLLACGSARAQAIAGAGQLLSPAAQLGGNYELYLRIDRIQ